MNKKLTVMEMSKYLGVSKEAIYNRLRRGTLESIIEDGKKYILLTDTLHREGRLPKRTSVISNLDSEYVNLLKTQIEDLKIKNQKLEDDKDRLFLDKERMLIESKEKIEQIYKERDEQLKMILTLANVPSLENNPISKKENVAEVIEEINIEEDGEDNVERDIVDIMCESFEDWKELRLYMEEKDYSHEDTKMIHKKVKKKVGKDANVKSSNGKLYIKKNTKLKHIIGKV